MAFGGGQGELNTAQVEGRTPLMVAVAQDRPMPVIRFLLDRGAAIDAETEAGNTALHFAAMYASDRQVVATLMALTEAPARQMRQAGPLETTLPCRPRRCTATVT